MKPRPTPRSMSRPARLLASAAVLLAATARCAPPPPKGVRRTYYIAADPVLWDYAPTGKDLTLGMGKPLAKSDFAMVDPSGKVHAQARVMLKAIYRAYTDSTFTKLKPRPAKWRHLGILGPVIRGAVGDTIVVWFKNNTDFPASVHPHGVFYDKHNEGALYDDGTGTANHVDDSVPPGGTFRYVWPVPERAGPGPDDPSSVLWVYHSHVDEPADVNAGLIGPLIITRRGMARADGSPLDVDREFVTMFASLWEGPRALGPAPYDGPAMSHYFGANMKRYTGDTTGMGPGGPIRWHSQTAELFLTINGLMYGNLPVSSLTMKKGEHVRWYVFAASGFDDSHTPHWHGNTVLVHGTRKDVVDLGGPLTMVTADMVPDDIGTWLYHCHMDLHAALGMSARYRVLPADGVVPADTAKARTDDPMAGVVRDLAVQGDSAASATE